MTSLIQDLRYALRQLHKSPGFTAIAVLTLAIGIGSTTAIFSVVYSVLLKPLPYRNSDRFISLLGGELEDPARFSALNFNDVLAFKERCRSYDAFGWFQFSNFNLTSPGEPQF